MYISYLESIILVWERQTTIDRIDVNWHYCKENCRRATYEEQAKNKRKKEFITFKWKKVLIEKFCEKYNFNYKYILRLKNEWMNWSKILFMNWFENVK